MNFSGWIREYLFPLGRLNLGWGQTCPRVALTQGPGLPGWMNSEVLKKSPPESPCTKTAQKHASHNPIHLKFIVTPLFPWTISEWVTLSAQISPNSFSLELELIGHIWQSLTKCHEANEPQSQFRLYVEWAIIGSNHAHRWQRALTAQITALILCGEILFYWREGCFCPGNSSLTVG